LKALKLIVIEINNQELTLFLIYQDIINFSLQLIMKARLKHIKVCQIFFQLTILNIQQRQAKNSKSVKHQFHCFLHSLKIAILNQF